MTTANVLGWFLLSISTWVAIMLLTREIHLSSAAKEALATIILNGAAAGLICLGVILVAG